MMRIPCVILCLVLAGAARAADLQISQPKDRAVFQRNDRHEAVIPVIGTIYDAQAVDMEVRAISHKTQQPATDWTSATALTLPTGWYRLECRVMRDGAVSATAVVEHVGVGEVFVTCGQSNSANYGQPRQQARDERVSTCDYQTGEWRHADDPQPGAGGANGSPWPRLGDLLAGTFDAPIGFICIGVGSTPVAYWTPGAAGSAKIKQALQLAGPRGVRAVLWHQGESDSLAGTAAAEYVRQLGECIVRSRQDAGWDIPWGVALASFHPDAKATVDRQAAIVAGQQTVIQTVPGVFAGPATDGYRDRGWLCDGVHFNAAGLAAHAAGWAVAVDPLLRAPAARP